MASLDKQRFGMVGVNSVSLFRKFKLHSCVLATWDRIYKIHGGGWHGTACQVSGTLCTNCDFVQAIEYGFHERMRYLHRKDRERARKQHAAKNLRRIQPGLR